MSDIFEIFKEIGFSINEAKVYTALVAKNPVNGYEVAKRANVTRTMVYDILNRMVKKRRRRRYYSKRNKPVYSRAV